MKCKLYSGGHTPAKFANMSQVAGFMLGRPAAHCFWPISAGVAGKVAGSLVLSQSLHCIRSLDRISRNVVVGQCVVVSQDDLLVVYHRLGENRGIEGRLGCCVWISIWW